MPRYAVSPVIAGGTEPLVFGSSGQPVQPQQQGRDQVLIGRLNESGARRNVFFDVTKETVVALFGKRGSGKSYTLGVLAESLCTVEHETSIGSLTRSRAVVLFDTLNVFWSTANPFSEATDAERFSAEIADLRRWGLEVPSLDVEVWIPNGSGSSVLQGLFRTLTFSVSDLTPEDAQGLLALDPAGPAGQLVADAWTMAAETRADFDFEDVLDGVENSEELAHYFAESTIRAVRQRLRHFAGNPFFTREGTPLPELLVPGRLTILEFGELDEDQRTIVSAVLLSRIHRARREAASLEKQLSLNTRISPEDRAQMRRRVEELIPPSWIMVDEAQTVFPSERTTRATDAFVRFVKEGRNFGLSFALTTQQPSAVDQRILSQVDTVICHQLTVESDIVRMRSNLKSAMPSEVKANGRELDAAAWLRSLEPGSAMVTNSDFDRAFAVEIRPRVCPHAGSGFVFEWTAVPRS